MGLVHAVTTTVTSYVQLLGPYFSLLAFQILVAETKENVTPEKKMQVLCFQSTL